MGADLPALRGCVRETALELGHADLRDARPAGRDQHGLPARVERHHAVGGQRHQEGRHEGPSELADPHGPARRLVHRRPDLRVHKLGFLPDNGIFAAVFFTLTGFHGAHVTGGILMNALVLLRATKGHFTAQRHLAVEAASIYWHFVDVVWIGLFTIIYIIG